MTGPKLNVWDRTACCHAATEFTTTSDLVSPGLAIFVSPGLATFVSEGPGRAAARDRTCCCLLDQSGFPTHTADGPARRRRSVSCRICLAACKADASHGRTCIASRACTVSQAAGEKRIPCTAARTGCARWSQTTRPVRSAARLVVRQKCLTAAPLDPIGSSAGHPGATCQSYGGSNGSARHTPLSPRPPPHPAQCWARWNCRCPQTERNDGQNVPP
mmetsp:Transcript_46605/g.132897  ORF Transcript_46605/g.132897 Transcript_46605/m.132897 type:complete len:217 (+) Transcript_46605:153-803(+)